MNAVLLFQTCVSLHSEITYLKLCLTWDRNLTNRPTVSLVTSLSPNWQTQDITLLLQIQIQFSNRCSIHVVPELEALTSCPCVAWILRQHQASLSICLDSTWCLNKYILSYNNFWKLLNNFWISFWNSLKKKHCVKSVQIQIESKESFFWSVFGLFIFPYSDWIFSSHAGKYRPEKTPYLNTFHAVKGIDICSETEINKLSLIWCIRQKCITNFPTNTPQRQGKSNKPQNLLLHRTRQEKIKK